MDQLKAASNRPYYDEAGDAPKAQRYYQDIPANASGAELSAALSKKLKATHTKELGYKPSTYLYPWIDLRPNLELQSIYSGQSMSAAAVIEADMENQRKLDEKVAQIAASAAFAPEAAATAIALAEAQFALNCEHVVPQSWFSKQQPMKGDLHHLFACETRCNSYRGNKAYQEFGDYQGQAVDYCGIAKNERFEPQANKGIVARATLYFLLRYPGQAEEYTQADVRQLLEWSRSQPVTLYEKHRNAAIEEVQGNRNPFIDHPEWADKIWQ
jgi:endonuclease I